MPLDPPLTAETKAWLAKATSDLRAAGHALTARPPLCSDSAFHCQQAAEKAMKGDVSHGPYSPVYCDACGIFPLLRVFPSGAGRRDGPRLAVQLPLNSQIYSRIRSIAEITTGRLL